MFTLVGVLVSIVVSYQYIFQGSIKNDLFEGEVCEWDGVNCAKYVVTISNSNYLQQQAANDNNARDNEAASTSSTTHTSADDADEIPSVTNNVHPPGVVGLGVRDEMIRLTIKALHFFIAKRQQYKYQPPLHISTAGPPYSPMSGIFWLTFAPSITLN